MPRRAHLALAGVLLAGAAWAAPPARAATTCTWAGTPDAPTGTFTIRPGATNLPASQPLDFVATGRVAGGGRCHGTMTFTGQIDAGSTCALASFEGTVRGLRGVARFWGKGSFLVPSQLYDAAGNHIGVENAEILTPANLAHNGDCFRPAGFTGGWPGMFSSVVVLF